MTTWKRLPTIFAAIIVAIGGVLAVTFPQDDLDVTVELYYDATWNDITEYVYTRDGIDISRGLSGEGNRADPSTAELTLRNVDGRFSPRNPDSPLYGKIGRNTQIRITVDSSVRFVGEVAKWPTQWNTAETDVYVPITAASISRRLRQGYPSHSPLYRTTIGPTSGHDGPIAYWPMEDGAQATQISSAFSGQPAASINYPDVGTGGTIVLASDDTFIGSDPLPVLDAGAGLFFDTIAYADTGQWVVQNVARTLTSTSSLVATHVMTNDYYLELLIFPNTPLCQLTLYDRNSASVSSTNPSITASDWDGTRFSIIMSGDSTGYYTARVVAEDGTVLINTSLSPGSGYATHRTGSVVSTVSSNSIAVGHYAVFTDTNFDPATDGAIYVEAIGGHDAELAHTRWGRLNTEAGIAYVTTGTSITKMGAQQIADLAALYDAVAGADHGIVFDTRTAASTTFRALSDFYNQAATLALTYGADGHVSPPLEPVGDDRYTANRVIARQPSGSSATAELTSGALSTQDPPNGVGVYESDQTVNVSNGALLVDHAYLLLALGTLDEERYPSITVNMVALGLADTATYAAAKSVDIGDRITIDEPPDWLPPGTVDQQVIGYSEHVGDKNVWRIAFTCRPHSVYSQVAVYGADAVVSRYDTAGSELGSAYTPGDATISLATTSGPLWFVGTTADEEFPMDLNVGGYKVTVSAISGASSPQTGTVVALSPALATRQKAAATAVSLWSPSRYAL